MLNLKLFNQCHLNVIYDFSKVDVDKKEKFMQQLHNKGITWKIYRNDLLIVNMKYIDKVECLKYKTYLLLDNINRDLVENDTFSSLKYVLSRLGGIWVEKLTGFLFFYSSEILNILNNFLNGNTSLGFKPTSTTNHPTALTYFKDYAESILSVKSADHLMCINIQDDSWLEELQYRHVQVGRYGFLDLLMKYEAIPELLKGFNKVIVDLYNLLEDASFILKIYTNMPSGTELVINLNENTLYSRDKRYDDFHKLLLFVEHEVTLLPLDSYYLERPANTVLLKITKH